MLKEIMQIKRQMSPYGDKDFPVYVMSKYVYRNISCVFSYLFLKTSISANQVSLLMLLIGFVATIFFVVGWFISGIIALHVWYMFDIVDGEIARIKNQMSVTGAYLDHLIHYLNHPFIFVGMGFGIYRITGIICALVLACIAGLFDVILRAKEDTYAMYLLKKISQGPVGTNLGRVKRKRGPIGSLLAFIVSCAEFPRFINLATVAVIANAFLDLFARTDNHAVLLGMIVFVGICKPLYALAAMSRDIILKPLDV